MSTTKERPILFQGSMIRAVLEGRKTVTRHPVKATKAHADGFMILDHGKGWWPYNAFGDFASDHEGMEYPIACPYGKPGDRLWVRETCFINDYREASVPEQERANCDIHYRADGIPDFEGEEELIRWRPNIHMPRWASRILLEVTDVRVERLRDITEEQALAEGIKKHSEAAITSKTASTTRIARLSLLHACGVLSAATGMLTLGFGALASSG